MKKKPFCLRGEQILTKKKNLPHPGEEDGKGYEKRKRGGRD